MIKQSCDATCPNYSDEDTVRTITRLERQVEVLKGALKTLVGYEPFGGLEPRRASEALAAARRIEEE